MAAFFSNKDGVAKSDLSRCRLKSTWVPPEDPDVAVYCRMLRTELVKYVPLKKVQNFDFVDRKARQWLARNREVVAVVDVVA